MNKTITRLAIIAATATLATACETNNINPYDYADPDSGAGTEQGSADVVNTALAQYPKGSIVWTHDTTLTESVEIAEGASLYIEPGVTVTCKADVQVPVELVVLGNLYCMGTAEKPVVFTSDQKKPASWGGIVCGYNSQEVVLAHVDLAYAGATPTESSPSFQNKLYKTTIDGGLPAFHFCNTNGRLAMVGCFMHDNYNDQTYFGGGQGVIYDNIMADSGNAADGGEGINIKAGCKMDVANNVLYNICTNGFKLSNQGNSPPHMGERQGISKENGRYHPHSQHHSVGFRLFSTQRKPHAPRATGAKLHRTHRQDHRTRFPCSRLRLEARRRFGVWYRSQRNCGIDHGHSLQQRSRHARQRPTI